MQRYVFIWYFGQIRSSFLFFRVCCCVGQRTAVPFTSQRHDFLIAQRCLFDRSFSPLQYHTDETAVSSLIHWSTKAMILQYHFIWYLRGTANRIQPHLDEKIILLYNCLSVIIYLPPDFHRLAIRFFAWRGKFSSHAMP